MRVGTGRLGTTSLLVALVALLALGCGSSSSTDPGGSEVSGGDEGVGVGEGGGGGGAGPGDPGGGDPEQVADRIKTLASVDVPQGVQAVALGADGALLTCEGGATFVRRLDDLDTAEPSDEDCPPAPNAQDQTAGIVLKALGAGGFQLGKDDAVSTDLPVFDIAYVGGGGVRWGLSASWLDARLLDLDERGDPVLAIERSTVGPLVGVLALENGDAVLFGPEGLMHVAVNAAIDVPRLFLSGREFISMPLDAGERDVNLLATNRGSAPLKVYDIVVEGEGLSVSFEVYTLDAEAPVMTPFELGRDESVLLTVTVSASPAGPNRGKVVLLTNDPDEPKAQLPVVVGRPPIAEGDPAPAFSLPDLQGQRWDSSDSAGRVMHLKFFNGL